MSDHSETKSTTAMKENKKTPQPEYGLVRNREGGLTVSPSRTGYCVLSADPFVVYLPDYFLKSLRNPAWRMLERARWKGAHILVSLTWSHENERLARRLARRLKHWTSGARQYHVMASTEGERALFESLGLDAIHCNHNAFLSEKKFFPTGVEKKYDAIYDAALAPFKRHELALEVRNLALISYLKSQETRATAEGIANMMKQATFLNNPLSGPGSWLNASSVNEYLNQAHVGLCLSATEGAMFASAQYLLAGLPVVTTKNRGGRDDFFDEDYVRWVSDTPAAVARAVDELVAAKINPEFIRNRTLERMAQHRSRLVDLMNSLVSEKYPGAIWSDGWPADIPHKLSFSA